MSSALTVARPGRAKARAIRGSAPTSAARPRSGVCSSRVRSYSAALSASSSACGADAAAERAAVELRRAARRPPRRAPLAPVIASASGAEEGRWKLWAAVAGALARVADEQPLAGAGHRDRELQRLGVGAERAQRDRRRSDRVQALALVVEQERVLARRRGEGALGKADDRDRAEAQVAKRVDVEHVHAAPTEGAGAGTEHLVAAQGLDRSASKLAEALEAHHRTERVEAAEAVEGVEDRLGVVHVALKQPPKALEMLGPSGARRMVAQRAFEVAGEGPEVLDALDLRGPPFIIAAAFDVVSQQREPLIPLLGPTHDPGLSGEAIPARDGGAPVVIARALRKPACRPGSP